MFTIENLETDKYVKLDGKQLACLADRYDSQTTDRWKLHCLNHQIWKIHDGSLTLSGLQLAARQTDRGEFSSVEIAFHSLYSRKVGSYLNTSISQWERTK